MDLLAISVLFVSLSTYGTLTLAGAPTDQLQAIINSGGIDGTVTFSDVSGQVTVTINVTPNVPYYIKIHERRVNFDTAAANWCSDDNIGQNLRTITVGSGDDSIVVSLSGTQDLEGRALVVQRQDNSTIMGCGNIEAADGEYYTAVATFQKNIGGQVIFRQRMGQTEAAILTDLYHIIDTDTSGADRLTWEVHTNMAGTNASADMCTDVGTVYGTSRENCGGNNHANCKMGDLSGKHGDVKIGEKKFYFDKNIALNGMMTVSNRAMVLKHDTQVIACANIKMYTLKQSTSHFSRDGVMGFIKFMQKSPLDATHIEVNLQNLVSNAGGYHVHKWPVPKRVHANDDVCSDTSVSGHFNPFSASYPLPAGQTLDKYEVGDLSGKFGSLAGKNTINETYTDHNIQLFGTNSIVGRSVVIHRNDGSASRWVCSSIELNGVEMITAIAKFVYPVFGTMIFRQPKDDYMADTQIFVELDYDNGITTGTSMHNWHVHVKQSGMDFDAETGRCSVNDGHYNPYMVDLSGNYPTVCLSNHVSYRCESGDLSGKHGKLSIRRFSTGGFQKVFATDTNIALSGPQSIVERSVVIHYADSGAGRLACANVFQIPMRAALVNEWTSTDSNSVAGSIKFSSDGTDNLSSMETIAVSLSQLQNAAGYHVHEFPSSFPETGVCSGSDVGGHFNPFNVQIANSPETGSPGATDDKYEIGDLSGKYGALRGRSVNGHYTDMNLPLRGYNSIVGRSVVIHKNDSSGTRWACGNIEEDTDATRGMKVVAKAEFDDSIIGSIVLTQYLYPGGYSSNTGVMIQLKYKNNSNLQSANHNWHVHVNRIEGDNCQTADGHYDPFHTNEGSAVSTYSECSIENPLRCEVGDQSNKLGPYNIGSGKKFFTDVCLPLTGRFGVLGRSFVVHAENFGANRIACADLLPAETENFVVVAFKDAAFNASVLRTRVAELLAVDGIYHDIIPKEIESVYSNCMQARVYFVGHYAAEYTAQFVGKYRIHANRRTLGEYGTLEECTVPSSAGTASLSVGLLLVCFISLWSKRH